MKTTNHSIFLNNNAFSYFAFYMYKGNFLLGARHNKLLEFPISQSAYVYSINGNPIFHYKFLWMDYVKKINFLKKLFASNSDLWYITNRYEFLGLLDTFAHETNAKLFHYNARRLFQEGYVGVVETLNFRMKLMGINNTGSFKDFQNSKDKYYFMINNEKRDKLFLDEMIEPGFNDEPRLCISTANTNSLYINSFIYGLLGNNVPMSSKFFYFSLLKRCAGTVFGNTFNVRTKTRFNNFSNHHFQRRIQARTNFNTTFGNRSFIMDSGWAASHVIFADSKLYNLRFNHIHNVFVIKKLFKYFRQTGLKSRLLHKDWKNKRFSL